MRWILIIASLHIHRRKYSNTSKYLKIPLTAIWIMHFDMQVINATLVKISAYLNLAHSPFSKEIVQRNNRLMNTHRKTKYSPPKIPRAQESLFVEGWILPRVEKLHMGEKFAVSLVRPTLKLIKLLVKVCTHNLLNVIFFFLEWDFPSSWHVYLHYLSFYSYIFHPYICIQNTAFILCWNPSGHDFP